MSFISFQPYSRGFYKKLRENKIKACYLGNYIPWDVKKQVEIIKTELGWKEDLNAGIPPEYAYEKVECQMQGIRDYIKFIKRGYARTAHLVAMDIRNGRLSKDEGEKLIKEYDGKRPQSLDYFLNMLELTEEEFNQIVSSHVVSPHEYDRKKNIQTGDKLPDRDKWIEPISLERNYTKDKLKEHGFENEK